MASALKQAPQGREKRRARTSTGQLLKKLVAMVQHVKAHVHELHCQGERIMSKITDFIDAQEAFNARQETAIDGVVADVNELKRLILELQNSPDVITPADQARLDAIVAKSSALAAKAEALDAATPPPAPPPQP